MHSVLCVKKLVDITVLAHFVFHKEESFAVMLVPFIHIYYYIILFSFYLETKA